MRGTFYGLLALVTLLLFAILALSPSVLADTSCESFGSGSIAELSSIAVPFQCSAETNAFFGVCDSGGIPNDDLFQFIYSGQVVSFNEYENGHEQVTVRQIAVNSGPQQATITSINSGISSPATFTYAISSDLEGVRAHLEGFCGVDYGGVVSAGSQCRQDVAIFTQDAAPSDGILEFRIQLGQETREEAALLYTWNIKAGEQINNDVVNDVVAPRWARVWWKPSNETVWYLLPSQYWHGDGTSASEYGVSCKPAVQASYHTAFELVIPEQDICFEILAGCNKNH